MPSTSAGARSLSGLLVITRDAFPRIKVRDNLWKSCLTATVSNTPWWRATATPILFTCSNPLHLLSGICWPDWDMSRRWFELVELYLSPRLICICRLILSRICRLIETPDMILRPPDALPRVSGCCIYPLRTQKHVCPNHQPSLIRARYNLPIFNVHRVVCVPSRPF